MIRVVFYGNEDKPAGRGTLLHMEKSWCVETDEGSLVPLSPDWYPAGYKRFPDIEDFFKQAVMAEVSQEIRLSHK